VQTEIYQYLEHTNRYFRKHEWQIPQVLSPYLLNISTALREDDRSGEKNTIPEPTNAIPVFTIPLSPQNWKVSHLVPPTPDIPWLSD
jgi:hypothetical protein